MIMVRRKRPKMDASNKVPRSRDVYVTQAMLYGVRDELKSHIDAKIGGVNATLFGLKGEISGFKGQVSGVDAGLRGQISKVDASLRGEIGGLKGQISKVDASLKGEINGIKSEIHRLAILMEEQNARNIIVLDGLANLFERQERIEQR